MWHICQRNSWDLHTEGHYLPTAVTIIITVSRLGVVMVVVLAIGPKVRGFKPGRSDGFLLAMKIPSRSSF
jgi:hypothetical protein